MIDKFDKAEQEKSDALKDWSEHCEDDLEADAEDEEEPEPPPRRPGDEEDDDTPVEPPP